MAMQNHSGFNISMGIILSIIGLPVAFVGLSGVWHSGLSGMGWIFLPLFISGLFIVAGGLQMYFGGRTDAAKHKEVETAAVQGKAHLAIADVIATWDIDDATWKAFCKNERKYRRTDNIIFFFLFLGLGAFLLMGTRGAGLLLAASVSGSIGLIIVLIRYYSAIKKIHVQPDVPKQVMAGKRHIIMNAVLYPINTDDKVTRKVMLIQDSKPCILELTIYWRTRNGETFDEFRFPVPENAIDKALEAAKVLKSQI